MAHLKLIIVLLGIISSFYFFDKKNISQSTVHKMLQKDFRIEASYCGCFGCWNETVIVNSRKNKRWITIDSDESTAETYEFTKIKEQKLELMLTGIIDKSIFGYSTTRG